MLHHNYGNPQTTAVSESELFKIPPKILLFVTVSFTQGHAALCGVPPQDFPVKQVILFLFCRLGSEEWRIQVLCSKTSESMWDVREASGSQAGAGTAGCPPAYRTVEGII